MKRFISPFCKSVIKSLEESPDCWRFGPCVITHTKARKLFWVGNGFFSYGPHEGPGSFSLIDKWYFGIAYKKALQKRLASDMLLSERV